MKRYDVQISASAEEDMEAIYKYIAENLLSPVTAAKQYNRIADGILSLEANPERIKIMDSEPEHSQGLRPLLVDNYTVFFVVTANIVKIVRVLYGASDISRRLFEE